MGGATGLSGELVVMDDGVIGDVKLVEHERRTKGTKVTWLEGLVKCLVRHWVLRA